MCNKLTGTEISSFKVSGYLGPFQLMTQEEMSLVTPQIEQVLKSPGITSSQIQNRHLDHQLVLYLATHPAIIERMVSLYGENLLLWRTNFFVKNSSSKRIPWHQDGNYWPLEPPVVCTAWIAIYPSTVENGCLQIIPGSHRTLIPHIEATDDVLFPQMGDEKYINKNEAVDVEMNPGEFILFNERTLHHSHPNISCNRRVGLAVRVIVPFVTVLEYDGPEHVLPIIHGKDTMGFNRTSDAICKIS